MQGLGRAPSPIPTPATHLAQQILPAQAVLRDARDWAAGAGPRADRHCGEGRVPPRLQVPGPPVTSAELGPEPGHQRVAQASPGSAQGFSIWVQIRNPSDDRASTEEAARAASPGNWATTCTEHLTAGGRVMVPWEGTRQRQGGTGSPLLPTLGDHRPPHSHAPEEPFRSSVTTGPGLCPAYQHHSCLGPGAVLSGGGQERARNAGGWGRGGTHGQVQLDRVHGLVEGPGELVFPQGLHHHILHVLQLVGLAAGLGGVGDLRWGRVHRARGRRDPRGGDRRRGGHPPRLAHWPSQQRLGEALASTMLLWEA